MFWETNSTGGIFFGLFGWTGHIGIWEHWDEKMTDGDIVFYTSFLPLLFFLLSDLFTLFGSSTRGPIAMIATSFLVNAQKLALGRGFNKLARRGEAMPSLRVIKKVVPSNPIRKCARIDIESGRCCY